MSTSSKNPFISFANASCGLVADQLSELSMQFDKAVTQSNALFNELATRGEVVEAKLKSKRNFTMNNSLTNWLKPIGFGKTRRDEQLDQLSKKVDALIDEVAALAEKEAKAKAAAKAPVKKPAARRTSTKPAAKAATKSAASSKSTPAAKTTRKPRTTKATAAAKKTSE